MGPLRAGAARADITPRLGCHIAGLFEDRIASDIHDPLYAKALVLSDGSVNLAIVVCDLIQLTQEDVEAGKACIEKATGITPDHVLMAATHTHYGPATEGALGTPRDDVYMRDAMERIADSVTLALNRLRPAEVGVATTQVRGESFNRRWLMKDGSIKTNPGYLNPDAVRPAGGTDPELILLAVRDDQRRPIALLANYSLHYVGGPYDTVVSADYFGYFERALQRMAGGDFVGIMANGFCGDINNCDFSRPAPDMPHPFFQAERVGNVVAAAAYSAWQGLRGFQYDSSPALGSVMQEVTFRRRVPTAAELEAARRIMAAPAPAVGTPERMDWIYAREALLVNEEPLERQVPVMALRVGDLGILGLPGEIFVDYGLQIKAESPFSHTMTVELANGCVGYCPTEVALQQGSYESRLARSAKAEKGTEAVMIQASLQALRHVHGGEAPARPGS